jgi:hypothetical protein
MTRGQKVVIVVLVLMLLVFAAVMLRGANQDDDCGDPERCARKQQQKQEQEKRENKTSPTAVLGRWLSPLAPKVELQQTRYMAGATIVVPPADEAFRMLRLRLVQGAAATVTYVDIASAKDAPLREQKLELYSGPEDKREGTLTATRGGGSASVACVGGCVVDVP